MYVYKFESISTQFLKAEPGFSWQPQKEKQLKMSAKKLKQEYMFFYDSHYARRFCAKFFQSPDFPDLCAGCGFNRDDHVKVSALRTTYKKCRSCKAYNVEHP